MVQLVFRSDDGTGTSEEDTRQFVVGYVSLVRAALSGDTDARDVYLESVIPALRAGGMPLTIVMAGMVRAATAVAAVAGPEHAEWLCRFQSDYTRRMLALWEGAA